MVSMPQQTGFPPFLHLFTHHLQFLPTRFWPHLLLSCTATHLFSPRASSCPFHSPDYRVCLSPAEITPELLKLHFSQREPHTFLSNQHSSSSCSPFTITAFKPVTGDPAHVSLPSATEAGKVQMPQGSFFMQWPCLRLLLLLTHSRALISPI